MRPALLGAAILLFVGAAIAAGLYVRASIHAESDDGRVHAALTSWDLGPRDAASREVFHHAGKPVLVKALAERVVELHAQPRIDRVKL